MATKMQEVRSMAAALMLEHKLPSDLERLLMESIVEHRLEHESAQETFGRLMQLAELSMQMEK